jgi:hypothetical protein
MNMSLIGFAGEPAEAKGIMSKELTDGSKTLSMAFFVVDMKGCYNVRWDMIGYMSMGAFLQFFISVSCSVWEIRWR